MSGKSVRSDSSEEGCEKVAESKAPPVECHSYKRRWYILFVFSFFCGYQAFVWGTWGPITYAVQLAYDWSDGTIALMANWGGIAYVVCFLPVSFLFEWAGARNSVLLGSLLVAVASGIRCLVTGDGFLLSVHFAQFINGIAGCMVMSMPPLISAIWFPDSERIFATAAAQSANFFGIALTSLLGPLAVPFDDKYQDDDVEVPDQVIQDTRDDIHWYMIYTAVVAAANFLALLAYFPKEPPKPPSLTTTVARTDFLTGWKRVLRSRQLWLIGLGLALPGVQYGWQSVMAIQFEQFGVTDTEVANILFLSVCCQAGAVAAVGLTMDHFRHRLKPSILCLYAVSCLSFLWLALLSFDVLPYSLWQLGCATVVATTTYMATMPLFFELALMVSYPIPEGLIGAFLTGTLNLFFSIFLLILMIDMDYTWITYALVAFTLAASPMVFMVKTPKDYIQRKD